MHAATADPVLLAAERLAPVAASAMQLRLLARLYDDAGQLERALTFVQRAVARAPIDP